MSNRVGIFWDYSSYPASGIKDKSGIALSLREECVRHGNIALFKAYFGLPGSTPYEPPSVSMRSEIEEAGVVTVDRPKIGFGAFAADVLCFLLDHCDTLESTTVVLVSGNPDIAYLVYALHARGARVGLVCPSGQLNKISSQASWTRDWENFIGTTEPPSTTHRPSSVVPRVGLPAPSTSSNGSNSNYSLIDWASFTRGLSTMDAPATSGSSIPQTKPGTTQTARVLPFAHVTPRPPKAAYTVTTEKVVEPLQVYKDHGPLSYGPTSIHKLQMFEDDPLYMELMGDPEAIKIKIWRRKLKQLYFYRDIRTNPQVPAEMDALYTSLEQCDCMSKNYLAFSKIGKLLTQIAQSYLSDFDYRQVYQARAKELLNKWEPLACSSND